VAEHPGAHDPPVEQIASDAHSAAGEQLTATSIASRITVTSSVPPPKSKTSAFSVWSSPRS